MADLGESTSGSTSLKELGRMNAVQAILLAVSVAAFVSQVILDQAAMIARVGERTVPEPADQADITARYQALLALQAQAARLQPDGSAA
jgi:hypothetical protein